MKFDDARRHTGKKTDVAATVVERPEGRFPMKAICDTLSIARSTLMIARRHEATRTLPEGRGPPAFSSDLPPCGHRPAYGYRRITRMLNRPRPAQGPIERPALRAIASTASFSWAAFARSQQSCSRACEALP